MNTNPRFHSLGSSETTREAPFLTPHFDFQFYRCPEHKKKNDLLFLEWFVGFTEGDGCFVVRKDGQKTRLVFEILQKDPQLIYKIRTTLGYGRVSCSKDVYWKYAVSDKAGIQRLITLFSGNLVLPKRVLQFQRWIQVAQEIGMYPSEFFQSLRSPSLAVLPSLETAWFAGFVEAEGCFSALVRPHHTGTLYRITQKFQIVQQDLAGEHDVLERFGDLLQTSSRMSLAKKPNVYRLEVSSLKSHSLLIEYFQKYPLQGKKKISYLRWYRVYLYRKETRFLSEKAKKKLERLCRSINQNQTTRKSKEPRKKVDDIVH